jgi:carboxylate-amine ligase
MADDPLIFKGSKRATIGLEWELQILDRETLDLTDRVQPLIEALPKVPWIKPEFIQSCVEIASKVCTSLEELKAHLEALLTELMRVCRELNLCLCGAGTHPFCRRLALVTPLPRYLQQKSMYGYLARSQITFATHVHLGMPDAETALTLMRELKAYLPVLIALSANSPFWRGFATGFACYRQRILASGRSYGIPPAFSDWAQFCHFFTIMKRAGVFETLRDIHWDIRPRPDLGTLEVRVMDAQSNLRDTLAIAAFIQGLADYFLDTPPEFRPSILPRPLPWWLEKENYFQATRLGTEARYIDDQGSVYPLSAIIESLFRILLAKARAEQRPYLCHLQRRSLEGLGWRRQLQTFRVTGRLAAVAAGLVAELC